MVVQHILCSRMGKREIKPTIPEMKSETSDEKNETSSEIKNKEEENESKEENSRKESETNKDENDIKNSDDKSINDNVTKDKSKNEVIESKQENTIDVKPQIIEVEEYFVKYRNFSYLHCEWRTEEELYKGDKRIQAKLKRFKQRQQQNTNIFENVIINS